MQQSSVNDRVYDGASATTTSTRSNKTTTRGDEQQQQRQQQLSDTLDSLAAMTNLCDPSVMDDDAFNASLDELLRDANCYDALATTMTTNVGTTIRGVGLGVGIEVVNNNNAYDPITAMMTGGTVGGGGGGRKRKLISSSGMSFSGSVGLLDGVNPDSSVSIQLSKLPPLHSTGISRQRHGQHGGGDLSWSTSPFAARSGIAPLSTEASILPNHNAIEASSQMVQRASLPVASTSLSTTLPPTALQSHYHSLTTDKPSSSSSVLHSRSLTCLMSNQQQQQQRSWDAGQAIRGQSAMIFSTTTNNSTFPPSSNNNSSLMLNDTWQTTQGVGNVVSGPLIQCGVVNTVLPEQQLQGTTGLATATLIIPMSCQSLGNSCYSGIATRMINGAPPPPQQHHQQQQPCSEVDEPESRRSRQSERNRREQERSHKITECITDLRSVLSEAGVNFKPDRYSTLVSVANYVKALQVRSINLDEEHKRLLDSVVEKTEDGLSADVKQEQTPRELDDDTMTAAATTNTNASCDSSSGDDELLNFVHGIDYRKVFIKSDIALSIASVDGRFVDCNDEFLQLTDYTREELLGDGPRRKSAVPHPQNSSISPSECSVTNMMSTTTTMTKKTGIYTRSSVEPAVTASTKVTTTTTKKLGSKENRFIVVDDLEGDTTRPPPEIRVRKHQHLSLFNLLGGEDMETVYAAMSRMLRAPDEMSHVVISKSAFTRSADESNVNAVSSKNATGDHWTGRVKHTRRKDQLVSVNSSLYLSKAFQREILTNLCVHAFSLYSCN